MLKGITLDAREFATTLSADLVRRIDEDIDRNLQSGQFWQDEGIALAQAGVRQPQLDEAFERWQAQGLAKYTVWQINQWRRHAGFIARRERPSRAIDEWYALDEKIRPLEEGIGKAVAEFDDQVNAQIHDRR